MSAARLPVALCAALLALAAVPARAAVFGRGGDLFVIETEHCSFVFPEECRADAQHLAAVAESVYARVVAFVGTDPGIRATVVLTHDSQEVAGYADNVPVNRMVVYGVPPSLSSEFGGMDDSLVTVFLHELTHLVSLNVKSGLWSAAQAVVGDVLAPNFWWMAGGELVEGVTVAAESETGFGRANDPLVFLAVRQAILEGKARSLPEARGGNDRWPGRSSYYWYGGLFTAWLRETFGAEKYAALWRELGNGNALVGSDGFLFLPGGFEAVYGLAYEDAWSAFLEHAAYRKPVVTAVRRLREEPSRINASSSSGGVLYWGDAAARTLFRRDAETGETSALKASGYDLSGISVRPGSPLLLLSEGRYTNAGSAFQAHVRAWDESTRAYVGPEYPDLREAAWMVDGGGASEAASEAAFAAVGIRGAFSDLVLVRGGRRETLLEGSYDRQIGSPAPLPDGRIAFLLRENGVSRIARIDAATRSLEVLETGRPLGIIRNLSASGDTLAFSWATREDFPSLGTLDPSGLRLQTTALSGGVTLPVASDSGIFYVGRFADGMRPCSYPGDIPELALEAADSRWVPHRTAGGAPADPSLPSRPYSVLPSLVPAIRIPYPKLGMSLEGMGICLVWADCIETWMLTAMADYDWTRAFADLRLTLQIAPPSGALTLEFSDSASYDAVESRDARTLAGGAAGTFAALLTPEPATVSLGFSASFSARAPAAAGAATAYAWPFASYMAAAGVSAAYDGRIRRSLDPAVRPTGLAASLALDAAAPIEAAFLPAAAAQGSFSFSLGALGLDFEAWAAATVPGVPGLAALALFPSGAYRGGAVRSGIGARYPVFREYASFAPAAADSWIYGYFSADWMPLAADVMRNVRDLKVFVTRIGASVGYRGALAGMRYLDAAYFRFHAQGGPGQGLYSQSLLALYGEVSHALRAAEAGVPEFSFGFGLSTRM